MTGPVRITRGIWRASRPQDHHEHCAVLLSCAPGDAVLADESACRVHGLWLPPTARARHTVIVTESAVSPRLRSHSERPELRTRRRVLGPDEMATVGGLPVTTLERTWLDMAERLSVTDLVALGDSALRGGASEATLRRLVGRAVHRRGVRRARTALDLLDARSRSRPESVLRAGLVLAGLPRPAVNEPIRDMHGQWLAEPDLSYEDVRLALEYNGADHADVGRMRRDITREFDMADRGGWRVVTLGPAEVFGRLDQTVTFVAHLRRRRAG